MLVVSYKRLWKLLRDRDMNWQDCGFWQKSAVLRGKVVKTPEYQHGCTAYDIIRDAGNVEDLMEFALE